jgi:hypothetical protein
MTQRRWLHRRPWVREGSPLWALLLLIDGIDWLAWQTAGRFATWLDAYLARARWREGAERGLRHREAIRRRAMRR